MACECRATSPYQSTVTQRRMQREFLPFLNRPAKSGSARLCVLQHAPAQNPANVRDVSLGPSRPRFSQVLADLFWHPQQILLLWNWKAAWLSLLLRGPIFLVATIRRGFLASLSALLTEFFICAVTAGFYGALVQNLRDATPVWMTAVFLVVVVPAFFQMFEFALHTFRGTPHVRAAEIVSLGVSAVSSLFNWYAMRRGVLLVGAEGGSFGSDLRSLPRLLFDFLATVPRKLGQKGRSASGGR